MKNKIITGLIFLLLISVQTIAFGAPNNFYVTVGPSTVQFQVIDPLGNKTGYEPSINGIVENIPNTMYTTQQLTTISDKPWGDEYHRLESKVNSLTSVLVVGKYQLKIFGSSLPEQYKYGIHIAYYQDENDMIYSQNNKTIIYPNVVWTYEFDVPATPINNGELIPIKVSTSADLIKDLTTAGQLGYIGNTKFVTELTKEINEIEAERSKVDPSHSSGDDGLTPAQKAKKEYTELLKEITEKYNKPEGDEFVKQEAYTVLREDLEYIIGHL